MKTEVKEKPARAIREAGRGSPLVAGNGGVERPNSHYRLFTVIRQILKTATDARRVASGRLRATVIGQAGTEPVFERALAFLNAFRSRLEGRIGQKRSKPLFYEKYRALLGRVMRGYSPIPCDRLSPSRRVPS